MSFQGLIETLKPDSEALVRRAAQVWILGDRGEGLLLGAIQPDGVEQERAQANLRHARLALPQDLPGAPELEIMLGNLEPILRSQHRLDARLPLRGGRVRQQEAGGFMRP